MKSTGIVRKVDELGRVVILSDPVYWNSIWRSVVFAAREHRPRHGRSRWSSRSSPTGELRG